MAEITEAKNSKAKIEANRKFTSKAYDKFLVYIGKGGHAEISAYVKSKGISLNTYARNAIINQLIADGADPAIIESVKLKTD